MFIKWRFILLRKVSKKLLDENGILIDEMKRNIGNGITFYMLHKRVVFRRNLINLIQAEQTRLLNIQLNKALK